MDVNVTIIHSDGTVEVITRPETPEEEFARLNPAPLLPTVGEQFATMQSEYDNLLIDQAFRITLLELEI